LGHGDEIPIDDASRRRPGRRSCVVESDDFSGRQVILEKDAGGDAPGYLEGVNWLRTLRARVAATDPLRKDIALALVFVVAGVVELATTNPRGESVVLTCVLGVLFFAPIALRRRAPEAAAIAFSGVTLVQGVLGDSNYLFDSTNAPFVAALFMLYSAGRYLEPTHLWPLVALLFAALTGGIALSDEGMVTGDLGWVFFMFGLPVLAGRALRSRLLLQRELREKAARAEGERLERARRATEAERDRIASELQAVVANGVSAMVVQAEAVPRVLAAGDTARASEALAVIEETGRDALMEMRRLLGVLRREGEQAALAPQPGLGRLEALVERQRERGLEIDLRVEGVERELAPGVDLTAYRVVEDALDAAIENGADRAGVLVRYRDGELQLEVRDDRSGGPPDRLPGLRDRVGLYGGHLSAGIEDGEGFRLQARLPLEEKVR
jgi:signal transduction histidine kinase